MTRATCSRASTLQVVESIGLQGAVASACPAQTSDQQSADFGYRPAMATIVEFIRYRIP
jgi:hypothetical protein